MRKLIVGELNFFLRSTMERNGCNVIPDNRLVDRGVCGVEAMRRLDQPNARGKTEIE